MAEGTALLSFDDQRILQYLLETDHPNWQVLRHHQEFTEKWVVFFLKKNRAIDKQAALDIYQDTQLRKSYQVRLWLVRCKTTPTAISMNLVGMLRWVDLMGTLRQPHLPGVLKIKIQERIMDLLPRLSLGEKISLAKQAPRALIRNLRLAPERRVIQSLLGNSFFTYEDAIFLANYPRTPLSTLEILADSSRWNHFVEIRRALLRNPRISRAYVLPLAKRMTAFELRQILKDIRIPVFTKKIIQTVLQSQFHAKKQGGKKPKNLHTGFRP